MSVENTESKKIDVRFYYWDKTLFDIFTGELSEADKIVAAQAYLKIDGNRDRIWQCAILTASQALLTTGWLATISLLNPQPPTQNFVVGDLSKGRRIKFICQDYISRAMQQSEQQLYADNRPYYIGFFNEVVLPTFDVVIERGVHTFSSAENDQLQNCKVLLTAAEAGEFQAELIPTLSQLFVSVLRSVWQQGEYGTRKKHDIYIESNKNLEGLYKILQISMALNGFKWRNKQGDIDVIRCDATTYHQLADTATQSQADSRKIQIPHLTGYQLQFSLLRKTRPEISFYFNDERSARIFHQQFCEEFSSEELQAKYGNINFSATEPQRRGNSFVVVCSHYASGNKIENMQQLNDPRLRYPKKGPAPMFIYRENSADASDRLSVSACYDDLQNVKPIPDILHAWKTPEKIALSLAYWRFVLVPLSRYFNLPGLDLVLQYESYLVPPDGSLLQVRFDATDATKMAIIHVIPSQYEDRQYDLLKMYYAHQNQLPIDILAR